MTAQFSCPALWPTKNCFSVDSEAGGKAAAIASLIETAKLNAVDLHGWLTHTFARIPDHKIAKLDDLFSWKSRA